MRISDSCPHCGKKWIDHIGIEGTCQKLKQTLTALKVIRTWAAYQGGVKLHPEHVIRLIDGTLDICGVERRNR